MIPDLAWWGRLLGLLATEATLLVALATVAVRMVRAAQLCRLVWQSAFLAVAMVWTVELAGGRSWLTRWQEPLPEKRQLTARVVGGAPVVGEEVAFEFPAEPAVPPPAPAPQPNWWPALLWLAGLGVLTARALGIRAWLAWRFRGRRRREALSEVGTSKSEVGSDQGLVSSAATETAVERLRRQLGLGTVRVQAWPQLRGPVAFGIFRPTVAVPADFETRFTSVQREAMLAHELAHLANRDPLWRLVAELVCALAWWHPAVWWARRQFRAACESAADEASTLVPGGRVALAEALVNFGRELTAPGGVGVAGSGLKSELARRVRVLVEGTGDDVISRPAGVWLVRCGIVVLLAASLLVPWPGDRRGLGLVIAATRAESPKAPSKPKGDLPASPSMPATEDARDGAATRSIDPIRPGLAYDQPLPGSSTRPRGSYVALEQRGPNPALVFPSFEFPGESLGQAVERISTAARRLDPAGHGIKVSLFGASDLSSVRIGRAGTLRNADLSLVLATLVQAAETPIQSALEGDLVTIAPLGIMSAQGQVALATAAEELKPAKRNVEAARAANADGAPELVAAEQRQEAAKKAFHDLAKRTQSATRQFAVNGPAFRQHLNRFLAPGETNLQAAILGFCATNGVEIPTFMPTATVTAPPPGQPAAFFDEAQGRLLVRATLADLERIEAAIEQLNLPPAAQHVLNLDQQRNRIRDALERIVIPTFDATDEPLEAVVRRLDLAAKAADPEGRGINLIINEPDESGTLSKTLIRAVPPTREATLAEVIAKVVAGAEKPILFTVESYAVVFNVWRDESKQIHTRRFNVPAKEFGDHLARFLPVGETNARAMQLAVRAFCATNGVKFPLAHTNAPVGTPSQDQPAVFYNDRTGTLFLRTTLENLERVERAIHQLNLPAVTAPADRRAELIEQIRAKGITLTELRSRYKDKHPRVAEVLAQQAELQAQLQALTNGPTLAPVTAVSGSSPTKPAPLINRRFQVDTDKFLVRIHAEGDARALTNGILAGTDPIEDAARRIEQLPNRLLIFAGGGPAPTSPGTLPRATPAVPLGESAPVGVARTNQLANVQVTLREYLRGHGVEFPAPDSETGQPLKELPAVFFDDRTGILFVRAAPEDMEKVKRALDGLGQPGPVAAVDQPRQSEPEHGNSQLIQTLEHDHELVTQQISRLRQDLENGIDVRSELEAKLKRKTDVEAKIKEQLGHVRQAANGGGQPESGLPQVQLSVFFAEITEGSADDIGLDWLFGQARTNNPAIESGLVTNLPAGRTPLNGDRLRVDRLAVAGQSAVLSAEQFAALKERLEGRSGVDFLTAPKVTTLSGRQAQVTVGEVRTLVTGVVAKDGSPTNDASVSYVTDQVSVGPLVDLFPAAEGTGWRVKVVASVTEFLGYDDPGATNRVLAQTFGGKPLKGTAPLPRLRMRETQAEVLAHGGETIALRGPLADEVIRFKDSVPVLGDIPMLGRLFRSEGSQVRHKRLYVFIQPVSIDAAGNRQSAPETK